ncbi:MAG: (d)CMP kinase [Bacteroidota bacterium]|nr:(d)CMP kinase [Bacteroidota bacterium]MDX5431621.1 (d)CMP kinase [Bacteroidota bacterium]MDX5470340.1 (d)CMP kinase [Bacteroidota bacterium]
MIDSVAKSMIRTGFETLDKALAARLGYLYIDTGAMYRAVALYFLRNQVPFKPEERDDAAVAEALQHIQIRFVDGPKGKLTFLNGENVEEEIRQMFVANHVSKVSTISAVRRFLVAQQQEMGRERGVVMDGRDIGTVVFPDAELKLFMTADPDIRAERRQKELQGKGMDLPLDEVKHNLLERDRIDSSREDSPLMQAEDAVVIDNSNLTPNEQLEIALDFANQKLAALSR